MTSLGGVPANHRAYVRHPAVAGETVLFVADDDIWIAALEGGRAHRLTDGRSGSSHPVPNPAGDTVAFTGRDGQHPEAFVMPLEGGPAERMTYLGAVSTVTRAWAPDGRLVVATTHGLPFARDSQLVAVGPHAGTHEALGWGSAHEIAYGRPQVHAHDEADTPPADAGAAEAAGAPGGEATILIGRHTTNQGRWKRYRGGTAGQLWLLDRGDTSFRRILPDLPGDIGAPMVIGDRLWFISDHDGVGNIYSCDADGGDLTAHSTHDDFYARFASTDGTTVVYTCGGDLWRLDTTSGLAPRRIDVRVGSPRVQRSTAYVDPSRWLQSYSVHPQGTHVALRVRGRALTLPLHDGPARQHGARQGANHRLVEWLPDGDRLVLVSDATGEERIEVHDTSGLLVRVDLDLGVPLELAVSPVGDRIAVTDQQGRLRVIELPRRVDDPTPDPASDTTDDPTDPADTASDTPDEVMRPPVAVHEVSASPFGIDGPTWSPDGRWLAYSQRESNWYTATIRLWDTDRRTDPPVMVTDDRAAHRSPAWDPDGHYLYWIAGTRFAPVADGMYFDHGFPHPDVVMAAVLQADGAHPLHRDPRAPGTPPPKRSARDAASARTAATPITTSDRVTRTDDATPSPDAVDDGSTDQPTDDHLPDDQPTDDQPTDDQPTDGAKGASTPTPTRVDVDGLRHRVVPLPLPGGRYRAVFGLPGRLMALASPLRPPGPAGGPPDQRPPGQLELLTFDTAKHEVIVPALSSVSVSADGRTMVYAVKRRLRAVRAGAKPPEGPAADGPPRLSGWLDLSRVSVAVEPPAEWRQLFLEAWRLQRDLFWHADMSGVDWDGVLTRYVGLIDRLATRAELSDLIWEMFGELGTGHAYERGGDHPAPPLMPIGHLGADLRLDESGWWVSRVLESDPTDPRRRRPLAWPGVQVGTGARLLAIDGTPVDERTAPGQLLVNRADTDVVLRVADPDPRDVVVRTLRDETTLRYADWVERNRERVLTRSGGRVGYVHVPDMGANGYAEFHRQYLSAVYADAIVVDVRFNGGGNVSSLLLEKLAGRRIGYQLRRTGALEPFPHHAPQGPLVAITNERCGSDGDIFCHAWKRLELGPVVGTRTWGGVIGIQPRHSSADGTVTTQPGFAFWFDDVGWAVENYGTDPTHPVEVAPHDSAAGRDPQLDTAIDLAIEALEQATAAPMPDAGTAPHLGPPWTGTAVDPA